jgi:hypothetical protein
MGGGHEDSCGQRVMRSGTAAALAGGMVGSMQAAWTDRPLIADQVSAHVRFAAQNIARATAVFGMSVAYKARNQCLACERSGSGVVGKTRTVCNANAAVGYLSCSPTCLAIVECNPSIPVSFLASKSGAALHL